MLFIKIYDFKDPMIKEASKAKNDHLWNAFAVQESLTHVQLEKFKTYAALLEEWNEKINITTIGGIPSIIHYHFQDSLSLSKAIDLKRASSIADAGTGGGFPGIPLAIAYPHLEVLLIEVSYKKIQFLDAVITALDLGGRITIFDKDWRSFLRTTDFKIDYICARASLQPDELIRMFKPGSPYKEATLIYWASMEWEPTDKVRHLIEKYVPYKVGNKTRRLVAMKR